MTLPDQSVKMVLKEEEIMSILFKEDLRGLRGDAFEGSEEEIKIFQGIFCNNGVDSLSDSNNLPGTAESSRAVQCRIIESFGHDYLCSYKIRCIFPGSRPVSRDMTGTLQPPAMVTSQIEPDAVNQTNQTELMSQEKSPTVPLPIAFPSSQMEPKTMYQTNQREVVNKSAAPVPTASPVSQVELKNLSQTQQRELISQDKRATPPSSETKSNTMIQTDHRKIVSQDERSTVPLPTTPPSSQVDQRDEQDEHGTSPCSGTLDVLNIQNPSLQDLCMHLRAHANRLLADCGYILELRRRNDRSKAVQYLYQLPNGGPVIPHLPKTWVSLGKLLQSSLTGLSLDETCSLGRQWVDIDEFASDLKSTLIYVEKMLRDPGCGLTLSNRWLLLDPFMAVACIDRNRNIGLLKKGVPVKAVQSTVSVLDENEMIVLKRNDVSNLLTYSRRACKKSLLPELVLGINPEKKKDGAVPPTGGEMILFGMEDTISSVTAGKEVPSATDMHITTGEEVRSTTGLPASPVTMGEETPCTADFHATPVKVGEVPITTGVEVQSATIVHASRVTTGEEAPQSADPSATPVTVVGGLPCPTDLHVNPVTVEEEVPITKDSCGNPVTLPDNISVRGTLTVNQTSQSTVRSSMISTLEAPFTPDLHVSPVAGYDNIPIGATFTINPVSESMVPQQPVLFLYPTDVPFSFDIINNHCQNTASRVEHPIYQASLFQGTLSFDANSGFQIQESPITWAVYKPPELKSKRKRKSTSDTREKKPRKRSKKNEEKSVPDTKPETCKRRRPVRKRVSRFHDDDLLISVIITKKSLKYKYPKNAPEQKPIRLKHSINQIVQLGQTYSENKKHFAQGARTVLRLLIDIGMISVNSKIQYQNSKGKKVKEGKLTRHGVLCQCCRESFTISGFRVHAGGESGNPGLNLFLGSGKQYEMCLFKAWSAEYKGRREAMRVREIERNNDMCGLCGDGGELVCCDSCPSSFHELCLPPQQIPEDCWHCPSCRCGACEEMITKSMEISSSSDYLQCSQCEQRFHAKCIKDKNISSSESPPGSWFCGNQCQQIYIYMVSQIGLANYIGDGFYFSILRCDHGQTKNLNSENLVRLAENNMKLALALRITEECFFPILDPRTGLDLTPLIIYNWRVNTLSLDYKGFYTVVLEKDERIISVASIRLHGAMVAEMPLVATTIENRKRGMCRRLVSAIEEMLKLLKVETLLLCAIPSLVDAWTSSFGFVPIEDGDKERLSKLSLINIPGTVFLKKDLREISVKPQVTNRRRLPPYFMRKRVVRSWAGRRSLSNE